MEKQKKPRPDALIVSLAYIIANTRKLPRTNIKALTALNEISSFLLQHKLNDISFVFVSFHLGFGSHLQNHLN